MKTTDAFAWLFKRFSNKTIVPCKYDIECLTHIAEWINREKNIAIQENTIFAKMYVQLFFYELRYYNDVSLAQKKLHEMLATPIEIFYDQFHNELNRIELNKYLKEVGFSEKRGIQMTDEEQEENNKLITNHQKDLKEKILGQWTKDKTFKALNNQITEAINKYKNLP